MNDASNIDKYLKIVTEWEMMHDSPKEFSFLVFEEDLLDVTLYFSNAMYEVEYDYVGNLLGRAIANIKLTKSWGHKKAQ